MQPYNFNPLPPTSLTAGEFRADGRRKQTVEDYEFVVDQQSKLKTSDLGSGAYGRVKRVREKATGDIYAMKIVNKQMIFRSASKENLKREIQIQKNIQHPHVIRLHNYFEDENNAYIVLEYAENGSLFEHIGEGFSEKEAFVFFFQTCLGLQWIHNRDIIHRDLKPENLLLDSKMNIKLCDFGWSTKARGARQTYCGTIDYMAPEIIKDLLYDHRVDIWSLGILLYEMLHGVPPFSGQSEQQKTYNIANNMAIQFGSHVSADAVDLIKKILKADPIFRLSMVDIFEHPWMKKYADIYNIDLLLYLARQQADGQVGVPKDLKPVSPREGSGPGTLPGNMKIQGYGSPMGQTNSGYNERNGYSENKNYQIQENAPKKVESKANTEYWWDSTVRPTIGLKQDHHLNADNFYKEKKPQQSGLMSPKEGNMKGYSPTAYHQVDQQGGAEKRALKYEDIRVNNNYGGERRTVLESKELTEIGYKNSEIEKQLESKKRGQPKPNLLEKMLMGIGVISKNPKPHDFD